MDALTPRLRVVDLHGPRTVPIDKLPFTLGRSSACDLPLSGADISRDHAHIVRTFERYVLEDRHSKYGTYVNGTPVVERPLEHGDRIELGRAGGARIVFLAAGESTEILSDRSISGDLGQLAGLLEALGAIGGERVLDDVLVLVLDKAIEIMAAERGAILLADSSGRLEIAAARAAPHQGLAPAGLAIGRTIPERVFATGSEEMVPYLPDLPDAGVYQRTIAHGIVNVMCTPLPLVRFVERGAAAPPAATVGVLYLDGRQRGRSPSATARAALQALAREAAVAIDSARLYSEALEKARVDNELRMAAAIQQSLLPPARTLAGFLDADGISLPCRAVGGDFYDYLDLPDGRFGVILADVAGKGPPAALLTAVLQGIVSALCMVDGDVTQVARRTNAALIGRRLDARFATAVLASLGRDGVLRYCNAGHNPPFVIRARGLERLTVGGPVLGIVDGASYEAATLQLGPGDTVVLFSDGVSEAAKPDGEEFGDERIAAVCEARRHASPGDLVHALLSSVQDFTRGVPQRDDMTVLVVRYGT